MSVIESVDKLIEKAIAWETVRCYGIADKIADIAIEHGISMKAHEEIMRLLRELKGGAE